MLQEMFERYFIIGFAAKEKFGEEMVLAEAFGHFFLQPAVSR